MSFKSYIDNYMKENGSTDPIAHTKAKYACAEHIASKIPALTASFGGPNVFESTLGAVYGYLGLLDEAITHFDAALKITPDDYNVMRAKIKVLFEKQAPTVTVVAIEEMINSDKFAPDDETLVDIKISYLRALYEAGQCNSAKYSAALNYMLTRHPDNIYSHAYAVRYHYINQQFIKFLHHLAKMVELTRDDEEKNGALGYNPEVVAVIAQATQTAIDYRDRSKTWLFIAHLMNSDHDPAAVLKLRETAAQVFPIPQKGFIDKSR